MKLVRSTLRPRLCRRAGATLTEYTFIIAIISIAGVILLTAIGKSTRDSLDTTREQMFGAN